MSKKPKISENEQKTFRDAMRDVKPIIHTKVNLSPPSKPSPASNLKNAEEPPVNDMFSDFETLNPVDSNTLLQYARTGIQHKILRNLRNGKYNVEAILDLHGKTVIEARQTLSSFLFECKLRRLRIILIIHGKGHGNKPVLKNKLNNWLRQTDEVLAFCSATYRDGSTGALYVLLKNASNPLNKEEIE